MLYETQNPHGGDVYGMEVRLDFSSNVNPLGPPPPVISAMQRACAQVRQYPDPYCRALTRAIAAHEGVPERSILCGAGAAELIYAYCDALRPKKNCGAGSDVFRVQRRSSALWGKRCALFAPCPELCAR